MRYLVHIRLDNVRRTQTTVRSDHKLERGDVLDYRDERAFVRSCHAVTEVAALRTGMYGERGVTPRKQS